MDLSHDQSGHSDDEYSRLDEAAFGRMIEKSIGLGEPTEVEERVMNETVYYRQQTDSKAAEQVSQAIYNVLLPQKIQEVKDEEIFQNFRPPAAGADDPLLTAPSRTNGPFTTSGSLTNVRKMSKGFPSPMTAALANPLKSAAESTSDVFV